MRRRLAPDEVDAFLKERDPLPIVRVLDPLLSDLRRARIEKVLSGRNKGLVIGLEEPWDPHNAAAVVRAAVGRRRRVWAAAGRVAVGHHSHRHRLSLRLSHG